MIDYDEDDEDYSRAASNILDKNTKKPRLLSERCETCIFHSGNKMKLSAGRVKQMVQDSINGGGYITCHSTLPGAANPAGAQAAVCRGFYDGFGHLSNYLRICERLGGFTEITPPPKGL